MSDGHDPRRPVGRNNPPRNTQFKPGKSGNPKGRPKNARNFATLFRDVFEQLASIKVDGKAQEIPYSEAVLMKARQMAMNEDSRLLCKLIDLMEKYLKAAESDARLLDQDEEQILARMLSGSVSHEATELRHTLTLHNSGFDLETSWMTPDDLAALKAFVEKSELFDRYMEGDDNALALASFIIELVHRPTAPAATLRCQERFDAILIKSDGTTVATGQTGGRS